MNFISSNYKPIIFGGILTITFGFISTSYFPSKKEEYISPNPPSPESEKSIRKEIEFLDARLKRKGLW